MSIDIPNISDKLRVIARIRERLGSSPSDFAEHRDRIREERKTDGRSLAAGVLLPFLYREKAEDRHDGEFVLQLIKRSPHVPQGGDLSGPGGMLHPFIDTMIMKCLLCGVPPIVDRVRRNNLKKRGRPTREAVALFLATAVRESWEEIGLNPCNVRLLGPLPCYRLNLFPRTIFPLAALVGKAWTFKPNWEVEKVVEIPLGSFFRGDNYGLFTLDHIHGVENSTATRMTFPCFIHCDADGREEILWGATFNIVLEFLRIVFDYALPEIRDARRIARSITPDYLTGIRRAK
ncbi:MAG: hypothetical protein NT072_08705 [Deltaproteobacteria bacterium]|nr:hypothetical protein [Deltaproteobacteria bacterium]